MVCDRCTEPLEAGMVVCPHCGVEFAMPVPKPKETKLPIPILIAAGGVIVVVFIVCLVKILFAPAVDTPNFQKPSAVQATNTVTELANPSVRTMADLTSWLNSNIQTIPGTSGSLGVPIDQVTGAFGGPTAYLTNHVLEYDCSDGLVLIHYTSTSKGSGSDNQSGTDEVSPDLDYAMKWSIQANPRPASVSKIKQP